MGSKSGGGYRSSPSSFEALKRNIELLDRKYPLDPNRRFGKKSTERLSVIETNDPLGTANEFWVTLSRGGKVREIVTKYGPGKIATFADKSHVVYRPMTRSSTTTSADNPSVEIDIRTSGHGFPPRYKIHFKRKGGQS